MSPIKISLGSDPEMMLVQTATGKVVSALDVLKKNKHDPIVLNHGSMYADNVLVECSVPPANSANGAVENIKQVLIDMQATLGKSHILFPRAAHVYDEEALTHPEAWEIGCNPSYNAWSETANTITKFDSRLRTGSFHVHIGAEKLHKLSDKIRFVKLLDIYLGCASVIFDKDKSIKDRRSLYGRAGEFRPTGYGLEYRVLGNYCLRSMALTQLVFDIAQWVIGASRESANKIIEMIGGSLPQLAINACDEAVARNVLFNAGITSKFMDRINAQHEPADLYQSWGIQSPE